MKRSSDDYAHALPASRKRPAIATGYCRRPNLPSLSVLPIEIIAAIIDLLGDADFWRVRRAHRLFRIDHPDKEFKRRALYWWFRVDPNRALLARRADTFLVLFRRKRIPPAFNPWPAVIKTGDIALFDAVRSVIPLSECSVDRQIAEAMRKNHLDLAVHIRGCYPDRPLIEDFIASVKHRRTTLSVALYWMAPPEERQRCAEYAAFHGDVGCVRVLIEQCHERRDEALSLRSLVVAAASNGRTQVLDAIEPYVDNPTVWIDGLAKAAACSSAASIEWIARSRPQTRESLQHMLDIAYMHNSVAAVKALGDINPSLTCRVGNSRCHRKGGCPFLRKIPSEIPTGAKICMSPEYHLPM
jgi:hypothetical protein